MRKPFTSTFNLIIAVSILAMSQFSSAGSDNGFYLGGSIGQTSFGTDVEELDDIDEDATGYKIALGYNFGWIPSIDLAVEADYRDFGSIDSNTGGLDYQADITAYDLFGLIGVKLGPIGLFGKLGFSRADSDVEFDTENFSDSDSSNAYGVGVSIGLGSLALRAEHEIFDLDHVDDLSMTSIGVTLTF